MKIRGIESLTPEDLARQLEQGAKFVIFYYCVSIIFISFRRSTDIYFIRPGSSAVVAGLPWTILSFLAGWWGLPWGLIYTPMVLYTNLSGGKDVTSQIVANLARAASSV